MLCYAPQDSLNDCLSICESACLSVASTVEVCEAETLQGQGQEEEGGGDGEQWGVRQNER